MCSYSNWTYMPAVIPDVHKCAISGELKGLKSSCVEMGKKLPSIFYPVVCQGHVGILTDIPLYTEQTPVPSLFK